MGWALQQGSGKPCPPPDLSCTHLVEPLDLLFLVLPLPGEWAQLVLQILDLLAQLLGLCCQMFPCRSVAGDTGLVSREPLQEAWDP